MFKFMLKSQAKWVMGGEGGGAGEGTVGAFVDI